MIIITAGKLSRAGYWKNLLVGTLVFIIVTGFLFWLLDLQNANASGASISSQLLAVALFMFYTTGIIAFIVYIVGTIMRRARDVGNTTLWTLIGIFVPFGALVLGLMPSRK